MKINTAALALLAASAAALPLSTINATLSAVNATANATATAAGPGESVNACVMPDGCRNEKKHKGIFEPPHTTWSQANNSTKTRYVFEPRPTDVPPTTTTITAEPTSSTPPPWGTGTGFLPWPTISIITPTTYTTLIPTVSNIPRQTPPFPIETVPTLPTFRLPTPKSYTIRLPTPKSYTIRLPTPKSYTIRLPTPKSYTIIDPVLPTGEPMA